MILWRARENAGSTAMVIENYIHGNVKRVAVGTYKESGCHVFHEKLKLICKAAGRTLELYRVCLLSHSSEYCRKCCPSTLLYTAGSTQEHKIQHPIG